MRFTLPHAPHPILLLVWVCLLLAPSQVWAQVFATVEALSQPDARGQWRTVDESPAAARWVGEVRTPLTRDMELALGDRIVTEQARVTIRLSDNESITVSAGSEITLRERSVLQSLGEVYYQVRDMFTVDYGTVQTAVEGTEFVISGQEGPVTVAVTDGVVRVSNAGEFVRVKRGQQVVVAPTLAPPAVTPMTEAMKQTAHAKAWSLGRPRLQLGGIVSGGLTGQSGGYDTRFFTAVQVLPMVNLVSEAGVGGTSDHSGVRLPAGLGLELVLGGFSFGGSGQVTTERWRYPCGGRHVAVHVGGNVHGRFTKNVTRRLFVAASGRVGGTGDGIEASAGIGGGVSL